MTVLSTVFFTWGLATVLNDILVPHLKGIFDLNYTQTMLIQFTLVQDSKESELSKKEAPL